MYLVSNSITRCIEICIRSFLTFFLLLEETLNHALKCFLQRIALDHSIARNIRGFFFFRQRILKFGQNIIFFFYFLTTFTLRCVSVDPSYDCGRWHIMGQSQSSGLLPNDRWFFFNQCIHFIRSVLPLITLTFHP